MTITTVASDGTKQCLQEQEPHAKFNKEHRWDGRVEASHCDSQMSHQVSLPKHSSFTYFPHSPHFRLLLSSLCPTTDSQVGKVASGNYHPATCEPG